MKRQYRRTLCAAGLITAALASGAFAEQQEEKLGTLSFPTPAIRRCRRSSSAVSR